MVHYSSIQDRGMNKNNYSEVNDIRSAKSQNNSLRVRDWLIDFVKENRLSIGARIPPERIIAEALNLSRPTVSKTIAKLAEDGMLEIKRRSGTYLKRDLSAVERNSGLQDCNVAVLMPWLKIGDMGHVSGNVSDTVEFRSQFKRESFTMMVAEGALSILRQHGCKPLIYPNDSISQECEVLLELLDRHVDGLIASPASAWANEHLYRRLADSGTQIVLVDCRLPHLSLDCVASDNFAGARDTVRYLISKGHRRIGMFADFHPSSSIQDRLDGYKAALDEAGISYDPTIVRGHEIMQDGSYSYSLSLTYCMKMVEPITAAFCINDNVLLSVLRSTQMLSLSSPGDIELAGFFDDQIDEVIPMPFTRACQRKLEIGRTAAEMLVEKMNGKSCTSARCIALPVDIVPRGQSAAQNPYEVCP